MTTARRVIQGVLFSLALAVFAVAYANAEDTLSVDELQLFQRSLKKGIPSSDSCKVRFLADDVPARDFVYFDLTKTLTTTPMLMFRESLIQHGDETVTTELKRRDHFSFKHGLRKNVMVFEQKLKHPGFIPSWETLAGILGFQIPGTLRQTTEIALDPSREEILFIKWSETWERILSVRAISCWEL